MKRTVLFRGTGTALVTPFSAHGELDVNAMRKLVEFQIRNGVEALLPTGTTGESVTLTDEEQSHVVEIVAEQTQGRIPVIAGAGSNSTKKAIALAQRMLDGGADGILSVGPYYNKPTQEGLLAHFKAVADSSDLPVLLYNVPSRTGVNMLPETVLQLAEDPRMCAVKEASGSLDQACEILRHRVLAAVRMKGSTAGLIPRRHDLGAIADVRLCDQCQSPTVVHGRDEPQQGIGRVRHRRRESQISCSRTQPAIETTDQTLIALAQRTNAKGAAIRQQQAILELAGIGNDLHAILNLQTFSNIPGCVMKRHAVRCGSRTRASSRPAPAGVIGAVAPRIGRSSRRWATTPARSVSSIRRTSSSVPKVPFPAAHQTLTPNVSRTSSHALRPASARRTMS